MARKRMISPEIWGSDDFSTLSDFAKLVFIGLFSQADDEGRGKAKPGYVRSLLFPNDEERRITDINKALLEIGRTMSIIFYEVDGSNYYQLTNWRKWQKIDKPSKSKFPEPQNAVAKVSDSNKEGFGEYSTNGRRTLDELNKNKNKNENRNKNEREDNGAKAPTHSRFTPPTLDEVEKYCKERNNSINAKRFIDYYTSKGWKVGNSTMRDWKATVRTWEGRETKGNKPQQPSADNERKYTESELNELFGDISNPNEWGVEVTHDR